MRTTLKPMESRIGTAGEYLVCSDLSLRGYSASMASAAEQYDVIVDIDNSLKRVQVKTRSKPEANGSYHFGLRTASRIINEGKRIQTTMDLDAVDYVALVALDKKLIAYFPIEILVLGDSHRSSLVLYEQGEGKFLFKDYANI